ARLVPGPQPVAKRLDDVIGCDADVRRALLEHLQDRLQHADDAAERAVGFGESPQAVEVPEELVSAVDQMDDHLRALDHRRALRNRTTTAEPARSCGGGAGTDR